MGDRIFGVVPKQPGLQFFKEIESGCMDQAKRLDKVTCLYKEPEEATGESQVEAIRELISLGVHGLAISVVDDELVTGVIEEAEEKGIPVITVDSDTTNSKRRSYIGTDNYNFGAALGKVLYQLRPEGGNVAVIAANEPNIVVRVDGLRSYLRNTRWQEVSGSPSDSKGLISVSIDQVEEFTQRPGVDAIVSVAGWPMFDPNATRWKGVVDANRNVTYICADTLPIEVELLSSGYANGLVGQVPYQMGVEAMNVLDKIVSNHTVEQEIFGTAFMEFVRVPLGLQEPTVDHQELGDLRLLGFSLFAAVAFVSCSCAIWTWMKRKVKVVRASQPEFLLMICLGVVIMASSLIPLSIEDNTPELGEHGSSVSCMSVPWLASLGFTVTFAALYSKTRRINLIFHHPNPFAKVKVSWKDVIIPFLSLLTANVAVLVCWTVLSPLQFVRQASEGTDNWNRVISTYGACRSDNAVPFAICLGCINLSALMIANWQAYEARTIQSEFAESKFIALVMACTLQACVIALPILLLVQELPQVYYLLLGIVIFVVSMATLLLIFVPKVHHVRAYQRKSETSQNRQLKDAIANSKISNSNRSSMPVRPFSAYSRGLIAMDSVSLPPRSQRSEGVPTSTMESCHEGASVVRFSQPEISSYSDGDGRNEDENAVPSEQEDKP